MKLELQLHLEVEASAKARLGKDAELLGKNEEIARLGLAVGEQARVLQATEERLLGEVARVQVCCSDAALNPKHETQNTTRASPTLHEPRDSQR